jgi:hypothetical protein
MMARQRRPHARMVRRPRCDMGPRHDDELDELDELDERFEFSSVRTM